MTLSIDQTCGLLLDIHVLLKKQNKFKCNSTGLDLSSKFEIRLYRFHALVIAFAILQVYT